jgi:hypothetical protein
VINLTVKVDVSRSPVVHPAEVGRDIAEYLNAFFRRGGKFYGD